MGAEIAVAALAAAALALVFLLAAMNRRRRPPRAAPADSSGAPSGAGATTCPLCGALLARGETVKSAVFPAVRSAGIEESMSRIYGCPRCWPANDSHPRICPYCRKEVPRDGWVIARYFRGGRTGRTHVHVLGCTGCRKGG